MKKRNSTDSLRSVHSIGIIFFMCLYFGLFSNIRAQSYAVVKDIAGFKKLYAIKSTAVNTLTSDFVQEKSISMMQNKINSTGSFIFKKTNKLRMEYTNPFAYLFIMNNDQIVIKNDHQKSSVSISSNKLFKMISQLTIDCITGNILNSKDFNVKISENVQAYYLVLIPDQKIIKSLFTEIDILISKSDFTVDRIELKETSGDNTTLTFSNKKINTTVSDEVFTIN
jgi:outer membrane lipoprotein-sorting protein